MDLTGKITIGGVETEFLLTDDGSFNQWGPVDRAVLGQRVDLLERLGEVYLEWRQENLCSDCGDATLDDGEGYDGRCGNCADRAECVADCGPDDDVMMARDGICTECGTDWTRWNGEDYEDFRAEQRKQRDAANEMYEKHKAEGRTDD